MICLHYIKVIGHLQLFVIYSFVAICVVCPVAIPEPLRIAEGSDYWKLIHFAMTLILQDDHLTAGAWATCVRAGICWKHRVEQKKSLL